MIGFELDVQHCLRYQLSLCLKDTPTQLTVQSLLQSIQEQSLVEKWVSTLECDPHIPVPSKSFCVD